MLINEKNTARSLGIYINLIYLDFVSDENYNPNFNIFQADSSGKSFTARSPFCHILQGNW